MSLINWIFDIYQHTRIEDARREAAEARAELSAVRRGEGGVDAARLQRALEELALGVKTLQRMMIDKGVCDAGEFKALLDRIDREDGAADGRSPV
jgi:hypothetical protein